MVEVIWTKLATNQLERAVKYTERAGHLLRRVGFTKNIVFGNWFRKTSENWTS